MPTSPPGNSTSLIRSAALGGTTGSSSRCHQDNAGSAATSRRAIGRLAFDDGVHCTSRWRRFFVGVILSSTASNSRYRCSSKRSGITVTSRSANRPEASISLAMSSRASVISTAEASTAQISSSIEGRASSSPRKVVTNAVPPARGRGRRSCSVTCSTDADTGTRGKFSCEQSGRRRKACGDRGARLRSTSSPEQWHAGLARRPCQATRSRCPPPDDA